MYADIGPSSFNHQSHKQPCIPAIDDGVVEYAQIKHNFQHIGKLSPSQTMQPQLKGEATSGQGMFVNYSRVALCVI